MAECFCGCRRNIRFSRRWFSNKAARHVYEELEVLRGAAAVDPPPENAGEMREIVARGDRLRGHWREYIHGTRSRDDFDRDALSKLLDDISEQRKRLALAADYVGWDMLGASKLFATGRRAPARLVDIDDTGTTINQQPRVEVVLRVEPEGEEPFEVRRKLVVSRVKIPKVGERVEVAYDPDDRSRFTFRIPDLTDDAGRALEGDGGGAETGDPLERLQKLHELHRAGALTSEEFEREKAQLLGEQQ